MPDGYDIITCWFYSERIMLMNIKNKLSFIMALLMLSTLFFGCVNEPDDIIDIDSTQSLPPSGSAIPGTDAPVSPTPPITGDGSTDSPNPTREVTEAPSPTNTGSINPTIPLNTMPTDLYGLSEAECEAWFADAVFVGDSLTIGWRDYNNIMLQNNPQFFGQTRFLCEKSYGAGHAVEPISDTSIHPIYGGVQHQIQDSISLMSAKKVFICFGLNDLAIWGIEGTIQNYRDVLNRIIDVNPDVEIYIISAMYMYRGSEHTILNNSNLRIFNRELIGLCNEMGLEFLDIASHLVDEDGFVLEEYSSDHYVHQTYVAYAIWAQILRSVAARHILGMPPVIFD